MFCICSEWIYWFDLKKKSPVCCIKVAEKLTNVPQGQLLYLHFITIFSSGTWRSEDLLLEFTQVNKAPRMVNTYKCFSYFSKVSEIQRQDSPALWIHREYFRLAGETSRPSLRLLWLDRVWTPEPSAFWQEAPRQNKKKERSKDKFTERPNKKESESRFGTGETDEAHVFVEKDPVEISRWGEKRFFQGEFTGGDLDAGVDGSHRAGRGGNLFHTSTRVRRALISLCATTNSTIHARVDNVWAKGQIFTVHLPQFYPPWLWTVMWTVAWPHRWL